MLGPKHTKHAIHANAAFVLQRSSHRCRAPDLPAAAQPQTPGLGVAGSCPVAHELQVAVGLVWAGTAWTWANACRMCCKTLLLSTTITSLPCIQSSLRHHAPRDAWQRRPARLNFTTKSPSRCKLTRSEQRLRRPPPHWPQRWWCQVETRSPHRRPGLQASTTTGTNAEGATAQHAVHLARQTVAVGRVCML